MERRALFSYDRCFFFSFLLILLLSGIQNAPHSWAIEHAVSSSFLVFEDTHPAHATPLMSQLAPIELHVVKNRKDVFEASSAESTSQGESCLASTTDYDPAGLPVFQNPASEKQESEDENSLFQGHSDSFYASLLLEQQQRQRPAQQDKVTPLSRSRDADLDTPGCCRPSFDTTETTTPVDSTDVNSPLFSQAHPPRTLQDLLTWRQRLVEQRSSEEAPNEHQEEHEHEQQQEHQSLEQASADIRSHLDTSCNGGGIQLPVQRTPLPPHVMSHPVLSHCSPQSPCDATLDRVRAVRRYQTLPPYQVSRKAESNEDVVYSYVAALRYRTLPARVRAAALSVEPPLPLSAPPSKVTCPAELSATVMHDPLDDERVSFTLRLLEEDVEASRTKRFAFMCLFLLLISFLFEAPYLPGGKMGIF